MARGLAAISILATSAAGLSWTALSTSATMPLVIAALLSARKCRRPSLFGRIDPHRGRAAAHFGRICLQRLGHRFELTPEVDQQPVAVFRIDQLIFFQNVLEGGQASHRRRTTLLAVAERLDFLGQAVLLLDGYPLEHLEPLLQLPHLIAQAQPSPDCPRSQAAPRCVVRPCADARARRCRSGR